MSRVKGAVRTRARHKKILKLAKGYFGAKSKLFRLANQAVMKSLVYAYRDRKAKKKGFQEAVDCKDKCGGKNKRFIIQQIHGRAEEVGNTA